MKKIHFIIILILVLFLFPAKVSAQNSDHVTVQGTVYIWNLDYAETGDATMGVNSDIPGGRYLPAKNLYVEVEFGGINIDKFTYTNKFGHYKITKSNPWLGNYSVNVEVRSSVLLGGYWDMNLLMPRPIMVEIYPAGKDLWGLIYEGRFNYYPYNGETGKITVASGETVTMDVYIGGPRNSIHNWWDDNPGDHLIGFYSVQAIREAYQWAVSRSITPEDIYRDTYILYRAYANRKARYQPFTPPPGIGHIAVGKHSLYPSDGIVGFIGEKWQNYRGRITHEYGHKIMHDVYTLVLPMGFQEPVCTGHSIDSTITGECGFIEGWAEFFGAAVLGRPTVNGQPGSNNLEHTYHPDPGRIEQAQEGSFTWRENVTKGKQSICEGENAAVFWDIYDPKGWEYMLPAQQAGAQRLTFAWPVPLRWYDRLNDNNLDDIWTILKEDDPDRMYDEINTGLWGWFNDGFYKYWRNRFSNDGDKIHGLKAILFNRDIETWPLDQTVPSIEVLSLDQDAGIATVRITEADQEDRPYLYFNIGYRKGAENNPRLMHWFDKPISDLSTNWQGNTLIVEIQLPSANTSCDYILMVHDSMQADFAELSINVEGNEDELDEVDQDWVELTLTEMKINSWLHPGESMIEKDGNIYVAAGNDGLRVYDIITHPGVPIEIGNYEPDYHFCATTIDIDGDYLYIGDSELALQLDISDPQNPTFVSEFSYQPVADIGNIGLDFYEGFVYYTRGWEGLFVLQPGTGERLAWVGVFGMWDGEYADLIAYEDTVYVVDVDHMKIFDISIDPTTPILVNTWEIDPSSVNPGGYLIWTYTDLELDPINQLLYVSTISDGVFVLDISTPKEPQIITNIITTGRVLGISLSEDVLYTMEKWPAGMTAVDVRNINEPLEIAYLEGVKGSRLLVVGNYAYINHRFVIVEIDKR